ncbi:MAG TPA: hypothetical protein VKT28_04080 [Puia sp.]|nr:hypothetical protein [Puia sp.]
MFTQTWKKYLPVIIILMKKASTEEQVLNMNNSDFMRAAGGRKPRLSFSNVQLNDGRISSLADSPPIAIDLMTLLKENDASKKITRKQLFEFTLNSSFQLTIRNNTPHAPEESSDASAETIEEKSSE